MAFRSSSFVVIPNNGGAKALYPPPSDNWKPLWKVRAHSDAAAEAS